MRYNSAGYGTRFLPCQCTLRGRILSSCFSSTISCCALTFQVERTKKKTVMAQSQICDASWDGRRQGRTNLLLYVLCNSEELTRSHSLTVVFAEQWWFIWAPLAIVGLKFRELYLRRSVPISREHLRLWALTWRNDSRLKLPEWDICSWIIWKRAQWELKYQAWTAVHTLNDEDFCENWNLVGRVSWASYY